MDLLNGYGWFIIIFQWFMSAFYRLAFSSFCSSFSLIAASYSIKSQFKNVCKVGYSISSANSLEFIQITHNSTSNTIISTGNDDYKLSLSLRV